MVLGVKSWRKIDACRHATSFNFTVILSEYHIGVMLKAIFISSQGGKFMHTDVKGQIENKTKAFARHKALKNGNYRG